MNRSPQHAAFQTMLFVMLAIYMLFINQINQAGWLPAFQYTVNQPKLATHYNLRFIDVNGETVGEDVYLDSPESWLDGPERRSALRIVNQLGIAVYSGDLEEAERLHDELTAAYFSDISSAQYELVLRVVRPVEKYALEDGSMVDELIRSYQFNRVVAAR